MAGVSIGTVDRVIHNRPGVSPKTKAIVQQIIHQVGYQPNPMARRLAGFKKLYSIAVMIPKKTQANPYWGNALSGIEKAEKDFSQFGLQCVTHLFDQHSVDSFRQTANEVLSGEFDALVLSPNRADISAELIQAFKNESKPVVLVDSNLPGSQPSCFIGQDAESSGALAAKLVSFQLNVNAKVLVVRISSNSETHSNLNRRTAGFRQALIKQYQLPASRILSLDLPPEDEANIDSELGIVLENHPEIVAIFCPNSRVFKVGDYLDRHPTINLFTIGYDLVPKNSQLLKKGVIDVIISQKPENQCFLAIDHIYRKLVLQENLAPELLTGIDLVFQENLPYYL